MREDIALHDEDYIARELYFYPNIPEVYGNYENYDRDNQFRRQLSYKPPPEHIPKVGGARYLTKQEALKRVPQTANALLVALKKLINHRQIADGKMICEQFLGIHRNNWIVEEQGSYREFKVSSAAYSKSPFHYWSPEPLKDPKRPIYHYTSGTCGRGAVLLHAGAPFELWDLRLSEKGKLKLFTILLPARISTLKITPGDVKKILGEPEKISVYPLRSVQELHATVYPPVTVRYQYIGKGYRLTFRFHDDPQKNDAFRETFYFSGRYYTKENKEKYHMEKIRQNTFDYYAGCALSPGLRTVRLGGIGPDILGFRGFGRFWSGFRKMRTLSGFWCLSDTWFETRPGV
ncbi:hypothetical protein LJC22_05860 [Desulfosarcina sp. OttesenSCG-928-G10]|nr:hypothetical protein [Desulfosarcina sp. OttesenSCG-928-G10]MDL2320738.1 hypothetical protein [Desulfosarcina sp. OttesenSCG-928-B08]